MAGFQETSGIPAQVMTMSLTPQIVPLDRSQTNYYFFLESDDVCFIRTGMDNMAAAEADIPVPPGAYGTKRRGNHTQLAFYARTGAGKLTIAYGTEDDK